MAVRDILLLGNPDLHRECSPVKPGELEEMRRVLTDMRDTLLDFRRRYDAGRAIAAPQIGWFKRVVYMEIDEPVVFVNPELEPIGTETMDLWDDCMSFPELLVKVRRYARCRVRYRTPDWNDKVVELEGNLSELLQHECDHLDGILAVSRAVDGRSFALRSQVPSFSRPGLTVSERP